MRSLSSSISMKINVARMHRLLDYHQQQTSAPPLIHLCRGMASANIVAPLTVLLDPHHPFLMASANIVAPLLDHPQASWFLPVPSFRTSRSLEVGS